MSAKKKAPGPSRALLDWLEANKVQYGPRRSSRLEKALKVSYSPWPIAASWSRPGCAPEESLRDQRPGAVSVLTICSIWSTCRRSWRASQLA